MDKFVVGFAFTNNGLVLLMEKNRPEWQKGCLNGVGGKIETGETPIVAMHRESMEEIGLRLNWLYRGIMRGKNNDDHKFECHIFYAYSDRVEDWKQKEDEEISLYDPRGIHHFKIISNLSFLIPYGLSDDQKPFMTLEY